MKHLIIVLALTLFFSPKLSLAQNKIDTKNKLTWFTDLGEAQKKSKATHKPIFALFTGSDWCIWCHKLESDVFAKSAFIKWAKDKVVLLELDFPRSKKLSPELTNQNNSLQQAFKVNGYPTVWIFFMDKDKSSDKMSINALGSVGYPQGAIQGKEEEKFIADANLVLANKTVN
jgi:protein disulfide-isomerase